MPADVHPTAIVYPGTILGEGVNLDLELAPCRRVGQDSCPFEGVRPPNVIQYVQSKGIALGQTVVVVVGYNDFEDAYATNIEDALTALQKAGVTHVLWATLRAVHLLLVGREPGAEAPLEPRVDLPGLTLPRDAREPPEGGRQRQQREHDEVDDELELEATEHAPPHTHRCSSTEALLPIPHSSDVVGSKG